MKGGVVNIFMNGFGVDNHISRLPAEVCQIIITIQYKHLHVCNHSSFLANTTIITIIEKPIFYNYIIRYSIANIVAYFTWEFLLSERFTQLLIHV